MTYAVPFQIHHFVKKKKKFLGAFTCSLSPFDRPLGNKNVVFDLTYKFRQQLKVKRLTNTLHTVHVLTTHSVPYMYVKLFLCLLLSLRFHSSVYAATPVHFFSKRLSKSLLSPPPPPPLYQRPVQSFGPLHVPRGGISPISRHHHIIASHPSRHSSSSHLHKNFISIYFKINTFPKKKKLFNV